MKKYKNVFLLVCHWWSNNEVIKTSKIAKGTKTYIYGNGVDVDKSFSMSQQFLAC